MISTVFSHDWEFSDAGHAVIQSINLFVNQCFTTLVGLLSLVGASKSMLDQSHSFIEKMAAFAFDKHSAYYEYNNQSSLNCDVREWVVQKEGGSRWRDSLKKGDQVDVLI